MRADPGNRVRDARMCRLCGATRGSPCTDTRTGRPFGDIIHRERAREGDMANPYVRQLARIEGVDGDGVIVGVDYDAVTIGGTRLNRAQAEEFARAFTHACWEAAKAEVEQKLYADG